MGKEAGVPSLDLSASGDTSTRIKAAAVYLFAMQGYAATGIRDIAKQVGITNAGVYHFVTNKETLLREIMRQGQQLLTDTADAALAHVEKPEDRLALLVSGLVGAHGVNQMISLVTDGEIRALPHGSEARAEILSMRDEYERLWKDVLAAGTEEGVFTIADHRLTRLALMAMCTGVSEWYRADGETDLDTIAIEFVDIALTAVRASREGRPITSKDVDLVDLDLQVRADWEPRVLPETQPNEEDTDR